MSNDYESLWEGDYIEIISPTDYPYEIVNNVDGVGVIPIVYESFLEDGRIEEIVVRREKCPPYGVKDVDGQDKYYTIVTGGIEDDETIFETALRELKEETGIIPVDYEEEVLVHNIPQNKKCAGRLSIMVMEIFEYEKEKALGDGSVFEEMSDTVRFLPEEVLDIVESGNHRFDFLFWTLYLIIKRIYLK